ncbi:MAG TPA: hypothetical protein VJO53_11830 [Candidatus Acidoferrales bacterium]|nr:hypothetical protein [Candidatus Acidoferrales bacterium]
MEASRSVDFTGELGQRGSGANPANFNYSCTFDNARHRTSVTEQSGRTVNYPYDNSYRLAAATVGGDPSAVNGTISYTYDPVGNRTRQTSTLPGITSGRFDYDDMRRLAGTTAQYSFLSGTTFTNAYTYGAAPNPMGYTAPNSSHNGEPSNEVPRLYNVLRHTKAMVGLES